MRFRQMLFVLLAASVTVALSCGDDAVRPKEKDAKWWVLVRQVGTPANGEVLLYNQTDSTIELRFQTPAGLESPHALEYDGTSLWVGGAGANDSIYEIDPRDGSILHIIPGIRTEGLAAAGTTIWYSTVSPIADSLIQINREGIALRKIPVDDSVINDLDTNGEWIYYAVNDDADRIVRVDPVTKEGADFILNSVDGGTLYTLAIDRDFLYVIDDQTQGHMLRTFNRETGEFISDTRFYIDEWITGLRQAD